MYLVFAKSANYNRGQRNRLPAVIWPKRHDKVKSGFARRSVYDRSSFASRVPESRTTRRGSREKPVNRCPTRRAVRSLQSGLSMNNSEIRAFSAYFAAGGADFLWSPDCVAEGEEFELPVQASSVPLRSLVSLSYGQLTRETSERRNR